MKNWLFTVWFQDTCLDEFEEDYKWCACFIIEFGTLEEAKVWGNRLSRNYAINSTSNFVSSEVEELQEIGGKYSSLPAIKYGYDASDEEIGW